VTPCSFNVYEESVFPSSGKSRRGAFKTGGGDLQLDSPPPKNLNLRNTDFLDMIVLKVLRAIPFSRNDLLNSTLEF